MYEYQFLIYQKAKLTKPSPASQLDLFYNMSLHGKYRCINVQHYSAGLIYQPIKLLKLLYINFPAAQILRLRFGAGLGLAFLAKFQLVYFPTYWGLKKVKKQQKRKEILNSNKSNSKLASLFYILFFIV